MGTKSNNFQHGDPSARNEIPAGHRTLPRNRKSLTRSFDTTFQFLLAPKLPVQRTINAPKISTFFFSTEQNFQLKRKNNSNTAGHFNRLGTFQSQVWQARFF